MASLLQIVQPENFCLRIKIWILNRCCGPNSHISQMCYWETEKLTILLELGRSNDDGNKCVLFYLKILSSPIDVTKTDVWSPSDDFRRISRSSDGHTEVLVLVGVLANSWNLIRTKDGAATHNTATHNTATRNNILTQHH